jgi:hypothetical protein
MDRGQQLMLTTNPGGHQDSKTLPVSNIFSLLAKFISEQGVEVINFTSPPNKTLAKFISEQGVEVINFTSPLSKTRKKDEEVTHTSVTYSHIRTPHKVEARRFDYTPVVSEINTVTSNQPTSVPPPYHHRVVLKELRICHLSLRTIKQCFVRETPFPHHNKHATKHAEAPDTTISGALKL